MPHTSPTLSEFRDRFPALAAVPDARVNYWLGKHAPVTTSWDEVDYADAILELTAHNIVVNGELPASGGDAGDLAGVTRFRSASMDIAFSERAANAGLDGGYAASKYGQRFKIYLRRNVGTVRLVGCI
ncbi:DUF4054 domain-containing protein [Sphingomonas soli]|uniref:DUF4054 domain-containing protein n=1 Tax=Sphingomonas soli TaxID=266127 RepID=UPI00082DE3BC|nr:DUF4054 domain-containing protein [Sphingomonas soli]